MDQAGLTRLQIETIDLYFSHFPDKDTPIEEAARIMADQKIGGMPVVRGDEGARGGVDQRGRARQQLLADDGVERESELVADLVLLAGLVEGHFPGLAKHAHVEADEVGRVLAAIEVHQQIASNGFLDNGHATAHDPVEFRRVQGVSRFPIGEEVHVSIEHDPVLVEVQVGVGDISEQGAARIIGSREILAVVKEPACSGIGGQILLGEGAPPPGQAAGFPRLAARRGPAWRRARSVCAAGR